MDDNQRHSTLLLLPPLGHLLEEMKAVEFLSHLQCCGLALPLIDFSIRHLAFASFAAEKFTYLKFYLMFLKGNEEVKGGDCRLLNPSFSSPRFRCSRSSSRIGWGASVNAPH